MGPLPRLLAGLCGGLLAAGAAGVAVHSGTDTRSGRPVVDPAARHPATSPRRTPPTTARPSRAAPAPTVASAASPVPAGPSSTTLQSGLITPTDMGGYYRVDAASAVAFLDSAPCLAALQASPAQSGRALTALLGPDDRSVPTIVEEVASYPGSGAQAVFGSLTSALEACSPLTFSFGGTPVTASVSPSSIPPVGQADREWAGSFQAGGSSYTVQYGAVLQGTDVIALVWIDSSPPSDAVMGSFVSTLTLATGKLA